MNLSITREEQERIIGVLDSYCTEEIAAEDLAATFFKFTEGYYKEFPSKIAPEDYYFIASEIFNVNLLDGSYEMDLSNIKTKKYSDINLPEVNLKSVSNIECLEGDGTVRFRFTSGEIKSVYFSYSKICSMVFHDCSIDYFEFKGNNTNSNSYFNCAFSFILKVGNIISHLKFSDISWEQMRDYIKKDPPYHPELNLRKSHKNCVIEFSDRKFSLVEFWIELDELLG